MAPGLATRNLRSPKLFWHNWLAMLLPRFSIRTLLAILTGVAVLSLFAGQAWGGRAWALGLTVAVLSVPVALMIHAAFFALGSAFTRLLGPDEIVAHTSRGGVERSIPAPMGRSGESSPLETGMPTP
jgi:hypothetical protein